MIDQIRITTVQNQSGKVFDQVRIWIGGIPFCADATNQVLAITKRIAQEQSLEIIDTRTKIEG